MRVLVVEDDPRIREAVQAGLAEEASRVDVAGDGHRALELLRQNDYQVAVVDRDIPGPSGDDLTRWIGSTGHPARVLMLSAATSLEHKERGFEVGADDYVTKPFAMRELQMRVRALGRRSDPGSPAVIELLGVRLDRHLHEVTRDGALVTVTRKQFAVLEVLMSERGALVSAEQLLERAWDRNADPLTNSVRFTISMLRKRLGHPWVIQTVPGVGYRIGLTDQAGDTPG